MPKHSSTTIQIGQQINHWLIINTAPYERYGNRRWLCRCVCGKVRAVRDRHLKRGNSRSCGCIGAAQGEGGSPTYRSWYSMHCRCLDQSNKSFIRYGGRGITVCPRWKKFENFLIDMGFRPAGHTLDRINNDGNYEPGNCKWSTLEEQQNNRRDNRYFEYQGRTQTISQWAREYGMSHYTLGARLLKSKWSISDALETPVRRRRPNVRAR